MSEAGVCKIKTQYILPEQTRTANLNLVSEEDKEKLKNDETSLNIEPEAKKPRLSKSEKKKLKGQNKSRGPTFVCDRNKELCDYFIHVADEEEIPACERNNCQNIHSIPEYLSIKPPDIQETCYCFETFGKCPRGLACRFGKIHISENGRNIINKEKYEIYSKSEPYTKNQLSKDVQWSLRKKTYNFDLSEKLINYNDSLKEQNQNKQSKPKKTYGSVTDEDIITLKNKEKKKINWKDKLYLSPLTTVGNLPFRRICKEFGADITCGEMAMCSSLLQGAPQEWALVKRHQSEDIFGVQLCANNPHLLTKCGQLLQQECEIDFVDLNLGCPIDLVFKQGGGSGLLNRNKILESCVKNLSDVLTIPMTVKTRTGVYKDNSVAHILAPKFRDWGVSLITIHGRSREQRYTRSANWAYIQQVAHSASPLPVFGNGDVLSFEDYKQFREEARDVQGIMIGRGALIKPWIFNEIKEQKIWDISSKERFDIIKKYVNYGLDHWGSDSRGVENTRRFLLEWLSFLYRYIPVGLLECPPQKINERPPFYVGRDDLETLMASPSASDWIKISEMLLGTVPKGFHFLPKHKANSYS
ncbi:tRNA-dihydrouridine(47) synthase [NAD(P)(+)]-like [Sitophilus oryzae]|uniref:tRNA-dihydrouridine(47) synthase [NAD(P)(+)] n=1 Tax=Sitophilus oryzae TaxID=7048 RepID=A0A6J2X690_SITOR|nr:tRNA-dihydrouridine(47) synthase [NAD(P)(+)]-like [Sitophilus oryzae]